MKPFLTRGFGLRSNRAFPSRDGEGVGIRHQSAFTMIEIAIALAVIAFALVAIIGVLPLGMNVQKENRQQTIINQDAAYFLEAIRNGAQGADDLTNYVTCISNYVWFVNGVYVKTNISGFPATTPQINVYSNANAYIGGTPSTLGTPRPDLSLTNGARIIGLLSTPKQVLTPDGLEINQIIANVRAISGAAADKYPQKDANQLNLAFSYRLISEIAQVPAAGDDTRFTRTFDANLHEVRLVFRWPILPNGVIGNGRQVYRTLAAGHFVQTNNFRMTNLFFLQPSTFATVQ